MERSNIIFKFRGGYAKSLFISCQVLIIAIVINQTECRTTQSPYDRTASSVDVETLTTLENVPKYLIESSLETTTDGRKSSEKLDSTVLPVHVGSTSDVNPQNASKVVNKIYKLGEKGSGTRPLSRVQDFHQLRDELLAKGELFEDREFPAQHSSLFGERHVEIDIEWVRPPGIVSHPRFYNVEGPSRFDVNQGMVGDCWLLASMANLAMHLKLFYQVVPTDQSFEKGQYAGIFHFRFWQYGKWVDVVIDDRLPRNNKKLRGLQVHDDHVFWAALLEKAYAKLFGSYETLHEGGYGDEGQEDFTGGITEVYEKEDMPSDMFDILLKAHEKNSLIGASLLNYDGRHMHNKELTHEKKLKGLIETHAYSFTDVRYVHNKTRSNEKIPLIRVRNPWGQEHEWTGPWGDNSSEWDSISEHEKRDIGFKREGDGEFWMSLEDVKDYFSNIIICYLNMDSRMDDDVRSDKKEWQASALEGQWVRGVTAGDSGDDFEKFRHNPQYRITLDEESTVIVALMQENRRIQGRMGNSYLDISFLIYSLNQTDTDVEIPRPLDSAFVAKDEIQRLQNNLMPNDTWTRQKTSRMTLQPGTYFIIPFILEDGIPDNEGEFLLRVYSDHPNNLEEYSAEVSVDQAESEILDDEGIEKVREFFRLLAGEDWKLDWIELKKVLDYEMYEVGEYYEEGFSKHATRSLLAMLDASGSGKVAFEEFNEFWKDFQKLKTVFHRIKGGIAADEDDDYNVHDDEVNNGDDDDNDIGVEEDNVGEHTIKPDDDNGDDHDTSNDHDSNGIYHDDADVDDDVDDDVGDLLSTFNLRKALAEAGIHVNNHILERIVRRFGTQHKKIKFEDFVMCAMRLKTMIDTFAKRDLLKENSATFKLDEWLDASLYL